MPRKCHICGRGDEEVLNEHEVEGDLLAESSLTREDLNGRT